MAAKTVDLNINKGLQTFAFEAQPQRFSAFQPIDIKPRQGIDYILNGNNNINFQTYKDAYDDSPTNSAIINAYVAYMYGEGLCDYESGGNLKQYISNEDTLLICQDFKIYGGCGLQIIWDQETQKPIRIKYIPVYKLAIRYDMQSLEVNGYWFSYDWVNKYKYRPQLYPSFTGEYKGNNLEIMLIRSPTAEPFFPVPDYISGIPWARVEGELGNAAINHFKNGLSMMTIINYNQGRQATTEAAKAEADKVRKMATGSENMGGVIVSFNDSADESVTVDQLTPPDLNQQNVFYAEEAERKLIVAHSAPPILFSGSQQGAGFSNNADEIAVATKMLYRKKINPMREILTSGLKQVFDLINAEINPWFKDFEEEKDLESNNNQPAATASVVTASGAIDTVSLDEKTLSAQANLKGSVGGVQALLDIQASYSSGATTYKSAIAMLDIIFGYNQEQAVKLLGNPDKETAL